MADPDQLRELGEQLQAAPPAPADQLAKLLEGSCDYELYGRLILEMLQGNHVMIPPSGQKENFHAVNPGELPCSSAQLYGNYFKNMQENFHAVNQLSSFLSLTPCWDKKKWPKERFFSKGEKDQEVALLTSGRLSHSSGPLNGAGSLSDSPPVSPEIDEKKHKTIECVLARESLDSLVEKRSDLSAASQLFFGGGGGIEEEEEQIIKGDEVIVELEASLEDLYMGGSLKVWREKNITKPAPGKRRCNCRNEVYHRQIGPGMY
ncbi:hypothetical protein ACP4OV_005709 [Aristida adscensionis]